jgi:hypothetical protein
VRVEDLSTQLPPNAIESMEIVTGTPGAEFGDKSSLIANITARSGLRAGRAFGNLEGTYGSFGSPGGSAGLGFGNAKAGNFLTADGVRSGRFLDTPELIAFHDKGNTQTIFGSLRLSTRSERHLPPQSLRRSKLDTDPQHLRHPGSGSSHGPAHAASRCCSLMRTTSRQEPDLNLTDPLDDCSHFEDLVEPVFMLAER